MNSKSKQIDMTEGNIARAAVAYTIPLMLSSLLQTLYNTVDSFIIGNFSTTEALAAVSSCHSPMLLETAIFIGLGTGIQILASQIFGTKDTEAVERVVETANAFFLYTVLPFTIIALLLVSPLLNMVNIDPASYQDAKMYLLIVFAGSIGTYGYNMNSGILRGLGDSRSPLIFLGVSCIVNIISDIVFVVVFDMGVVGVAIATDFAMILSWLFSVVYIKIKIKELNFRVLSTKIDRTLLSKMLNFGLPIAMNQGIFSIAFLFYYRFVNAFGAVYMAGYGVATKIEGLVYLPLHAIGTTATTFSGQNYGAGNLPLLKKGSKYFVVVNCIVTIGMGLLGIMFGKVLLGFFTNDMIVIERGYNYLLRLLPFYWMYAIIYTFTGLMNGTGDTKVPLIISMIMFWCARLPIAWLLSNNFGGDNLHFSYPASWVFGTVLTMVYYYMFHRKKI